MYTMGIQIQHKLNHLQHILPEGLVVDSAWLQGQGYSRALISKYASTGWLHSPVRGLYRRPSGSLSPATLDSWEPLVVSLQQLLDLPVTPGGRTALELQGYAHYLAPNGPSEIHLYGAVSPPSWASKITLEQTLVFHTSKLFRTNSASHPEKFSSIWNTSSGTWRNERAQIHYTNKPWGSWNWPLIISTPERAALELLANVPQHETFDQADAFFEGLTSLSPKRLTTLLAECRSIKVNRLFMWFAERHNHPWFSKLDRRQINLGSGKRAITPGGRLDKKYLITVPREFSNDG